MAWRLVKHRDNFTFTFSDRDRKIQILNSMVATFPEFNLLLILICCSRSQAFERCQIYQSGESLGVNLLGLYAVYGGY
jgi:hypothetical protein